MMSTGISVSTRRVSLETLLDHYFAVLSGSSPVAENSRSASRIMRDGLWSGDYYGQEIHDRSYRCTLSSRISRSFC